MLRRASLFLLAALALGFAPAPFPKREAAEDDLKKLQGKWVRSHYILNGNVTGNGCEVTVAGTLLRYNNTPGSDEWTVKLDPRKKPKQIDLISATGPKVEKKRTFRGIYRLEKDKLTIHSRPSDHEKDRPTTFEAGVGIEVEVFTRKP